MAIIVLSALALSIIIYLIIGLYYNKHIKDLGDIIPIIKGRIARVKGDKELSASNVATSISLATVIVAFFDLVPGLGLWLLWPAITTAAGFWLFAILARKIWHRMSAYDHRPSLHEFLGTEFNSKNVAFIASLCTTIGYLSAFAVELTVGSRFLAGLLPGIPEWITIIIIASAGLIYTAIGGFRTVIVTDRIQMGFIWLLLFSLLAFYGFYSISNGTISSAINHIPASVRLLSWSSALIPFIIGILVMNLFTYISNMGLWQRIAGTAEPETIVKGMRKTVYHSALSWSLFAIVAVGAFIVVSPIQGENLLITLMNTMNSSLVGKLVLFCVTLGLYGAMLSTASTQLIAISHTIYEDILAPFRKISLSKRLVSKKELRLSRVILVISAVLAVVVVEILRMSGFSVADLAFSIYGAALGLVPPILFALFTSRDTLKKLGLWTSLSLILGFASAWTSAILGKVIDDGDLVFWAPVFGFCVSGIILSLAYIVKRNKKTDYNNPSSANEK